MKKLIILALLLTLPACNANLPQPVAPSAADSLTREQKNFKLSLSSKELELKRLERGKTLLVFFEAFLKATQSGDLQAVKELIQDTQQKSPLHNLEKISLLNTAIVYQQNAILNFLLENLQATWPPKPDEYESVYAEFQINRNLPVFEPPVSPLNKALEASDRENILAVIQHLKLPQKELNAALQNALLNEEHLKILIEQGADPQFHKSPSESTLLESAILMFDWPRIQFLEAQGIHLNQADAQRIASQIHPSSNGSAQNVLPVLEYLVQKGASFNAPTSPGNIPQIFLADDLSVLKFLLQHGANLHETYKGSNLLTYKVIHDKDSLIYIDYLLSQGLLLKNAPNIQENPIYFAIHGKKFWLVKMLVEHGADIKTHAQELLNLAQEQKQTDIYDYLKAQGI